jgi:Holliday junction DNA helicase RuvA
MIGRLRGQVLGKSPQEVLVDVGGVGYRVQVPLSTYYGVGEIGANVALLIHTHVREYALALFGFLTASEHELFECLIGVSGVGPRLATNILSGIEAGELTAALAAGDLTRLTRVPGVGKKTAERLVLELREVMQRRAGSSMPAGAPEARQHDLLAALSHLGYSRPEAERAAGRVLREHPEAPIEDCLRRALHVLSTRS